MFEGCTGGDHSLTNQRKWCKDRGFSIGKERTSLGSSIPWASYCVVSYGIFSGVVSAYGHVLLCQPWKVICSKGVTWEVSTPAGWIFFGWAASLSILFWVPIKRDAMEGGLSLVLFRFCPPLWIDFLHWNGRKVFQNTCSHLFLNSYSMTDGLLVWSTIVS